MHCGCKSEVPLESWRNILDMQVTRNGDVEKNLFSIINTIWCSALLKHSAILEELSLSSLVMTS